MNNAIDKQDGFASHWEGCHDFPENTLYSLPLLTKRGDHVYQTSFLYSNDVDDNRTVSRPFAWFLLPLNDAPEYTFSWCKTMDFISTKDYPLNLRVSSHIPLGERPVEERESHQEEIFQLYGEIVAFAFEENLTTAQKNILARYEELFLHLCYRGFYPFYQAIAPDFFQWIGLILLPEPENLTDGFTLSEEGEDPVATQLSALAHLFQHKIAEDLHKKELFDQVHKELLTYKSGEQEHLTRGMERDVILLIDHLVAQQKVMESSPPTPTGYQRLLDFLETVHQDLIDLLYRQGVDPYIVEGNTFVLPKQKVLETLPTTDPNRDKVVAERLTQGWEKDGIIIRPEYVRVYLYSPEEPPKEDAKELLEDE